MSVLNPFGKSSGYMLLGVRTLKAERKLLDFSAYELKGDWIEQEEDKLPFIQDRQEAFIKCRDLNHGAACKLAAPHGEDYQGEKWCGVFQLGVAEVATTTWDFADNYSLATHGIGEMELSAKFAVIHCEPTADEPKMLDLATEEVVEALRNYKPATTKPKPSKAKRKTTAA